MKNLILFFILSMVFTFNAKPLFAQLANDSIITYSEDAKTMAADYFNANTQVEQTLIFKNLLPVPEEVLNSAILRKKFSQILNREAKSIKNIFLYNFISKWMNTKYHYGGTTKAGIDCSGFTGLLMRTVYSIILPRTAREQYRVCNKITREYMKEGDMVFFNTRGGISHVGLYLGDDYFVHSSSSNGVIVSNLNEPYYKNRFISGGRYASVNLNSLNGFCQNPGFLLKSLSF